MAAASMKLPRKLPLLIIDGVLFPGASIRIPVTSYRNMNMVKSHLLSRSTLASAIIGVVPKENASPATGDEDKSCMHAIGTAGIVVQVTGTNWPRPSYTLLVTGLCRFRLEHMTQETPYLVGSVRQLDKLSDDSLAASMSKELVSNADESQLADLMDSFREQAGKLIDMLDLAVPAAARLKRLLNSLPISSLPDVCAAIVRASHTERLQILDAVDLAERFQRTLPLLERQIEGLQLLQKAKRDGSLGSVSSNGNISLEKLGPLTGRKSNSLSDFEQERDDVDVDGDADDVAALERKIKLTGLSDAARKVAIKELNRLKKMPVHMPEHAMTRNYLELMCDLPWKQSSPENVDLVKSRADLDSDHYGLDKLKRRVVEYLAVRQLKNSLKGPILCFVGPPGVGKTSVGRSIARSLGRQFHRISLGGVCDQADIRGHRRTYIGSMPGRIIQGLRTVGVRNPVFLLDEIDKMSSGIHGDPSAALLEVLDPEQNCSFTDHYLNIAFDLSQVLFIATANTLSTIPAALLDRMEVIVVPGYTHDEKLHIAQEHLVPKQLREHGLNEKQLDVDATTLATIISKYTREAGVRGLERKISAICRAVAVRVVEESAKASGGSSSPLVRLDDNVLEAILGPAPFENELAGRLGLPGVALGLAWTATGGEIMFVEASRMEGDGQLILTGQLGDVMQESAKLALNWIRAHVNRYAIPIRNGTGDLMEGTDVHIHFPAGAVGKDGPSAGVTIVTALMSLFTGRIVAQDLAMTGEITLRGLVLPVGGIKSKILAAHRSGMRRILLPRRNEKDLLEIPNSVKSQLSFHLATHIDDVLQVAFDGGLERDSSHEAIESHKLNHFASKL